MDIQLEPGTYVVAVSGGVDSMVLLDMLRRRSDIRLIVAHFDHGIRRDSELDRQLVQGIAAKHGLAFVFDRVELGPGASEADARKARYDFLHRVREATGAHAIVTAHHQDDLVETAILNLMRGTGRKGLSSLASTDVLKRPLLNVPKKNLLEYAKSRGLEWREDATNRDTRYVRNYVRHKIMPFLTPAQRRKFLKLLETVRRTNVELDDRLDEHLKLHPEPSILNRKLFAILPHAVSREVMAAWLRRQGIRQFDKDLLENLTIAAKTLRSGKRLDVDAAHFIEVSKDMLALQKRGR